MFSQDPVNSCDKFDKIFLEVLDKMVQEERKYFLENNKSVFFG